MPDKAKPRLFLCLLWMLEGVLVGFGAILPGVSGAALCVAFGLYRPLIETLSSPLAGIRKHGITLAFFALGGGIGFVGLSGIAAALLQREGAAVTCLFIGLILGTLPSLWKDAGIGGHSGSCCAVMLLCFAAMVGALAALRITRALALSPAFGGWLLCGAAWGLSFIVPGLSSSSLLLFFGLYQPMLAGIAALDPAVLLPMIAGAIGCVLLLAKAVSFAYRKHYAAVSHGVLGIVTATAVMILPTQITFPAEALLCLCLLAVGAAASFGFCALNNTVDKNFSAPDRQSAASRR